MIFYGGKIYCCYKMKINDTQPGWGHSDHIFTEMDLLYLMLSLTQYKQTGNWWKYKLCCGGFILALFQSATANKIVSEHTQDNKKLFLLFKVELLQVTVNKIEVLSSF